MTPHEPTDAQVALALRDWLEQGVNALPDGMQLPAPVRDQIISQLPTTPQRRRWWTDRWSTRGRGVMRSDGVPGHRDGRRSRRMFGFATLLAAGAIGGAALLAGVNQQQAETGPRTIVVAQDGSGDVATITEGVALAVDGDTVLIRPGVYPESLIITADITLQGDGDREAVIIEPTEEGPLSVPGLGRYALEMTDTTSLVADLTLRGEHARLVISGGSPVIEDLHLIGVDVPFDGTDWSSRSAIYIIRGSAAVLRGNVLTESGEIGIEDDAAPIVENNTLIGGSHIFMASGSIQSEPIIRGNTIEGALYHAIAVFTPTTARIEDNVITGAPRGINVMSRGDNQPVISGNTLEGNATGIVVEAGTLPTIEGNTITEGEVGVHLTTSDAILRSNTISGHSVAAMSASGGGAPVVEDNTLDDNAVALAFSSGVAATVTGNTLCGNAVDQQVDGEPAPLDPGNTRCASDGSPVP